MHAGMASACSCRCSQRNCGHPTTLGTWGLFRDIRPLKVGRNVGVLGHFDACHCALCWVACQEAQHAVSWLVAHGRGTSSVHRANGIQGTCLGISAYISATGAFHLLHPWRVHQVGRCNLPESPAVSTPVRCNNCTYLLRQMHLLLTAMNVAFGCTNVAVQASCP
jgi:hypothetical protein